MNVFLLMVALTCPVEAPKAGLQEAAAATAAVASEEVLPTVNAVSAVETNPPQVSVIRGVETTPPQIGDSWGGISTGEAAAKRSLEWCVSPAPKVEAVIPPRLGVLPCPVDWSACSLADMYSRRRPLSGPWSITRRLEAARMRGDEDEVKRLTAMLEEVVGEALEVEGTEP